MCRLLLHPDENCAGISSLYASVNLLWLIAKHLKAIRNIEIPTNGREKKDVSHIFGMAAMPIPLLFGDS